jgi:hypothetical protein
LNLCFSICNDAIPNSYIKIGGVFLGLKGKNWSQTELYILEDFYKTESDLELSKGKLKGRSETAIMRKRQDLGFYHRHITDPLSVIMMRQKALQNRGMNV